jgi:hypothetical protein
MSCSAAAAQILEETLEQTYVLDAEAVVSVRNTDGSIRVYGSDGNEMKLQATKHAYTQNRLDKIRIDIAADRSRVTIDTHYPPSPKWGLSDRSGTVDYILVLPWRCGIEQLSLVNGEMLIEGMRGKNVQAKLGTGRFFARNNFCNLSCAVDTGALDLAYDWWEKNPRFAVAAKIVDGTLRAFIPADALFHLNAQSRNGKVASDFVEQADRKRGGTRKVDLVIGTEPQMDLQLEAVEGNVRVVGTNR